jgi:ketosteroid isomerase-like protein
MNRQSDEQTIINLEREWAKHSSNSDTDASFFKGISAEQTTFVDALGHLYDMTSEEAVKTAKSMNQADPQVKVSVELNNIKVRIFADTAVVTYDDVLVETGHKDKRYNFKVSGTAQDIWQKQSGKWKIIAASNTSTEPIAPEKYKLPPPPGLVQNSEQKNK